MKTENPDDLITANFGMVYIAKQARRQKRQRKLKDKERRGRR